MAGPDTATTEQTTEQPRDEGGRYAPKVEAAVEFPDEALTESEDGTLTPAQFAARVEAKIEEAAQNEGLLVPPGLDLENVEPISTENSTVLDEPPVIDTDEEEAEPPIPEDADEEEQALDEVEEEEPEAEEGDFYVGRYRTKEEAQEALAEKDATINRLFQELHERGQRMEQALQQQAQEQPLDRAAWQEWAAEAVENGAGQQGALEALKAGGREGYMIYLGQWQADDEQRADAMAFHTEVTLSLAEQTAARQTAPLLEQARPGPTEEAEIAKARAAAMHDDFDQYEDARNRLISEPGALPEETKQFLAELASQGLDGKVRAWDYLHMAAVATGAPNRRKAKAEERKQRKTSADRAKVAATVSSAEGTQTRTPPDEAELTVIRYKNQMREKWDLPLLPEE